MAENSFSVEAFSKEGLVRAIAPDRVSHGSPIPDQVEYLGRYCEMLGAKTFVTESHYIDRHYVDEFASYYSRKVTSPSNITQRIHIFSHSFTGEQFEDCFRKGIESCEGREEAERFLTSIPPGSTAASGYLGYIVVRPIITVPVGRTVLARVPDEGVRRDIWATNRHTVHLGNLSLKVNGLAFQQQDAAVGACATAALWSALTCAARHDGMRAPTPAEISDAAVRNPRASNRTILAANHGLTVDELCEATRAFNFSPEVFGPTPPEDFASALHTYLLSGIPVVLALQKGNTGHAVTAAGFQLSTSPNPVLEGSTPQRSSRLNKIYIHDDRMGPYAKAFLKTRSLTTLVDSADPSKGTETEYWLELEIGNEVWVIVDAFAPVYPKLRLTPSSLLLLALYTNGLVEEEVGDEAASKLTIDFRYERSGDYLARLSGKIKDPVQGAAFVQRVSLSRWCAIIRWYLDEVEFVELVFDTTDVVREAPFEGLELLKALVSLHPSSQDFVKELGEGLQRPWA